MKKFKKRAHTKRTEDEASATAASAVAALGARVRELRSRRHMTLLELSKRTKLSTSMLSLVERGRASPSIGSLIVIANALGATMSDIIELSPQTTSDVVVRSSQQPAVEASNNLMRRILKQDRAHGVLISLTDYKPNSGSSPVPRGHEGYEHGFVLEGQLTVELNGATYVLEPGDLISYRSDVPHRIWNYGRVAAKALWFNLQNRL